jgi:solute carrier family 15 (peptide/histidine transporter), member 3/4
LPLLVLVVAFRNRKLELPEKLEEAQDSTAGPGTIEGFQGKNNLKLESENCIPFPVQITSE